MTSGICWEWQWDLLDWRDLTIIFKVLRKEPLSENFAWLGYIDQKNDHEINDTESQFFKKLFFLMWAILKVFIEFLF